MDDPMSRDLNEWREAVEFSKSKNTIPGSLGRKANLAPLRPGETLMWPASNTSKRRWCPWAKKVPETPVCCGC